MEEREDDVRQQRRQRGRPRGRPERAIDPTDGPLSSFAYELRQARAAAGNPTYRVLAAKALFAPSVLSTAASGMALPTLQVTLAYAGACGADTAEWRRRWESVAAELAGTPASDSATPPVDRLPAEQLDRLKAEAAGKVRGEHACRVEFGSELAEIGQPRVHLR